MTSRSTLGPSPASILRMAGLLGKLLGGDSDLVRLARFFDAHSDPWARMEMKVPVRAFGMASERDFCRYLEGTSRVDVRSVEEVCAWLQGCEAIDDESLFVQADYWQHPITFEHLRKGDCEDHALWAWRKLRRLGFPTLFIAGVWKGIAHTWVVFEQAGRSFLLETTAKDGAMLHPLAAVRHCYLPGLGVDDQCQTYVYQGYQQFRACLPAGG